MINTAISINNPPIKITTIPSTKLTIPDKTFFLTRCTIPATINKAPITYNAMFNMPDLK